jgi:hypothetical protein
MGTPERVINIEILAGDESIDESRIVGFLPRIESEVIQKDDARRKLGQPGPDRTHVEGGVGLPSGSSEVRACGHLSPSIDQPAQRGQRGPDALVIGDLPTGHRNIEITPNEDVAPRHLRQVLEFGKTGSAPVAVSSSRG